MISFYISTTSLTWWVSLMVDTRVPEGTCSQVLRSTSVDWFAAFREQQQFSGPCKVRNETETKRNETKQIETKRNKSKRNETNRNETKQIETKRNKTKRNKSKRNETSCMERQIDIYSINERALKIIRELSNSIGELCNSIKECSYWIESSWIQLESSLNVYN